MKKIILHLCADIGSDSYPFQLDDDFEVICIGKEIGVENYTPPRNVYGVFANPPCTEFSTARADGKARNPDDGMFLVEHCLRIIEECNPKYKYEPWWYGSPWTKQTALWGDFNIPDRLYTKWEDVPKLDGLYTRPGRGKPSLAFMHARAHMKHIPEFKPFMEKVLSEPSRVSSGVGADMSFRSLCSQGFANQFYKENKNEY